MTVLIQISWEYLLLDHSKSIFDTKWWIYGWSKYIWYLLCISVLVIVVACVMLLCVVCVAVCYYWFIDAFIHWRCIDSLIHWCIDWFINSFKTEVEPLRSKLQFLKPAKQITMQKGGILKNRAKKNQFWFFPRNGLSLFLVSGPLPSCQISENL